MKLWLFFIVLMMIPIASAARFEAGDILVLEGIMEENIYATGGTISLEGDVEGDFIGAGGSIQVNGKVTEDVNAAGGDITLNGEVNDDVRAAGGNILINNDIGGDLVAAGGSVIINDITIGEDLTVSAGSIICNADIMGDARFRGGQITINGMIEGDTITEGENVVFGKDARIKGDLTYVGSKPRIGDDQVLGRIREGAYASKDKEQSSILLNKVWAVITIIIMGGILFAINREWAYGLGKRVKARFWASFGFGLVMLIGIPLLSVIIMVTIIGIPLGIFMLFLYAVSILLSFVVGAIAIGMIILNLFSSNPRYSASLVLGAVAVALLKWIPVAGGIIMFLIIVSGLGSIGLSFRRKRTIRKIAPKPQKRVKKKQRDQNG
ncbi:MAG: hypothetical protein ABIH34_03385 [Nanoarchaeota archaeon]